MTQPDKQCYGAGAATFRVEPEPIFLFAGAALKKAPTAASFWQAKKGKPCYCECDKHDLNLGAIYKDKYDPIKTCINNSLFKSSQ